MQEYNKYKKRYLLEKRKMLSGGGGGLFLECYEFNFLVDDIGNYLNYVSRNPFILYIDKIEKSKGFFDPLFIQYKFINNITNACDINIDNKYQNVLYINYHLIMINIKNDLNEIASNILWLPEVFFNNIENGSTTYSKFLQNANCQELLKSKALNMSKYSYNELSQMSRKEQVRPNPLTHVEYNNIFNSFSNIIIEQYNKLFNQNFSFKDELINDKTDDIRYQEYIQNYKEFIYIRKIKLEEDSIICNIGDIHASAHSLVRNLLRLNQLGYINDELYFHNKFYMIFTGDLIDRGFYSPEVMYIVMRLYIKNPNKILIVRGNHEDYETTLDYGFDHEMPYKYSRSLFLKMCFLFYLMPSAVFISLGDYKWIQYSHGGFHIDGSSILQKEYDVIHQNYNDLIAVKNSKPDSGLLVVDKDKKTAYPEKSEAEKKIFEADKQKKITQLTTIFDIQLYTNNLYNKKYFDYNKLLSTPVNNLLSGDYNVYSYHHKENQFLWNDFICDKPNYNPDGTKKKNTEYCIYFKSTRGDIITELKYITAICARLYMKKFGIIAIIRGHQDKLKSTKLIMHNTKTGDNYCTEPSSIIEIMDNRKRIVDQKKEKDENYEGDKLFDKYKKPNGSNEYYNFKLPIYSQIPDFNDTDNIYNLVPPVYTFTTAVTSRFVDKDGFGILKIDRDLSKLQPQYQKSSYSYSSGPSNPNPYQYQYQQPDSSSRQSEQYYSQSSSSGQYPQYQQYPYSHSSQSDQSYSRYNPSSQYQQYDSSGQSGQYQQQQYQQQYPQQYQQQYPQQYQQQQYYQQSGPSNLGQHQYN